MGEGALPSSQGGNTLGQQNHSSILGSLSGCLEQGNTLPDTHQDL